jgi:hypothetical protein
MDEIRVGYHGFAQVKTLADHGKKWDVFVVFLSIVTQSQTMQAHLMTPWSILVFD